MLKLIEVQFTVIQFVLSMTEIYLQSVTSLLDMKM